MAETGGTKIGTMFAEIDLDDSKYDAGLKRALDSGKSVSIDVEKAWKTMGTKSTAHVDNMRASVVNAYQLIKNKSTSTTDDILRAEIAAKNKLESINKKFYGGTISYLDSVESAAKRTSSSFGSMAGVLDSLKTTMLGVMATMGVAELIKTADTWKLVEGRLKLVTTGTGELVNVQSKLFDISQNTRQSFEQTGDLYSRVARSTKELKLSQEQLLGITDTINKSLVISGASSQSADAALMQLGQAFAAGALRGEELNSVLEQAPRLAEAIAQSMGVSVGSLKNIASEGKITSKVLVDALSKSSDAAKSISNEFDKMPRTVGQSLVEMGNATMKMVGEFDKSTGATAALADGISSLAKNLDTVADVASVAAIGAIPVALMSIVPAAAAAGNALKSLNIVMLANPWTAAATGILMAGAALYQLNKDAEAVANDGSIDGITAEIKRLEASVVEMNQLEVESLMGGQYQAQIEKTTGTIALLKRELDGLVNGAADIAAINSAALAAMRSFEAKNDAATFGDIEKKYEKQAAASIEAQKSVLARYRETENAKPAIVEAMAKDIANIEKAARDKLYNAQMASVNKQKSLSEKAARDAKAVKEKEFKDLLEFNQKKYAYDIAMAENIGEDSWLAREKGMKEAMERSVDYQEKETQAIYDAEQERLKIAQDAAEKHAEAVKDANADILDTVQDYTADIIADWDNAGDTLVNIAKRTAAEMAAAFISQQFIMPVVQAIGSAAGLSWNGVAMSDMGATSGTTGANSLLSSASSLYSSYSGGGIFGGLTSYTLPGTATLGSELGWGAAAAQDVGMAGGVSLGSALGYGAAGGLGYRYLGGAIGLPQDGYSGIGSSLGGAVGGAYGAAGAAAMGVQVGAWAGPIGAAIGAVLGGVIGSLFGGDDQTPRLAVSSGGGEIQFTDQQNSEDGFNFHTWVQDLNDKSGVAEATVDIFDNYFTSIDDAVKLSLKDVMASNTFRTTVDPTTFEGDTEGMFVAMFDDIFTQLRSPILNAMGLSADSFDIDFFEGIQEDGEDLFTTFARFAAFGDSISDFAGRINSQMEGGATAEEAFANLVAIQEVIYAVEEAASGIATSSSIDAIRGLITAQGDYLAALKAASATEQELADVQVAIAQQVGASISGLTADSLQSVLVSGGDIKKVLQDTLKNTAAQTIAGLASESIMTEYGNSLNELIGNAFKDINTDDIDSTDLTSALNSIITDFDWAGMESESAAAAAAIADFMGVVTGSTGEVVESTESIKTRRNLEIQIMELEGKTVEALALSRQYELEGMTDSNKILQERIWVLTDEAAAAQEAAAALSAAQSSFNSAKSAYLSALNAGQQALENNVQTQKTAYSTSLKIGSDLASLLGDTDALQEITNRQRQLELDAMDEAIRPMQERLLLLQDEAKSIEALNSALSGVQGTIDSILGSSDSVQSEDYMSGRYSDLLASAKLDPTKSGEFTSFSTQYLDFISDYGDPKARERVLSDLRDLQDIYLDSKQEIEDDWYSAGVDTFDLDYIRIISGKQTDYFGALEGLNNSWYAQEIKILTGLTDSIDDLKKKYLDAGAVIEDITNGGGTGEPGDVGGGTATPSYAPMPDFSGVSQDNLVGALYGSIGRSGFGSADSNIDWQGYYHWKDSGLMGADLVRAFMTSVNATIGGDDPAFDYVRDYIKNTYGVNSMSFSGGGILSGPTTGYDVSATFHGTEAIVQLDDGYIPVKMTGDNETMKRVEALLTKLVTLTTQPNGETQVRVYVGNKELKDITAETIRTSADVQRTIKRVANV